MKVISQTVGEALRLAELGYRVFPCNRVKKPAIKGWPDAATNDAAQITRWFSNTDFLLAVKTGSDTNLFVVDVDPDGMDWLKENQDQMLCERVHETRRGKHFLYEFPDALKGVKTNTVGKIHAGIDTRGEGGYLIWWPAHGLGGSGDLTDLTEPPSWLVDALVQSSGAPRGHPTSASNQIEEGSRNDSLTSYCGSVWAKGASKERMLALALNFNTERNLPPLDASEVRSVVESISRYPQISGSTGGGALDQTEDSLALSFVRREPHLRYVALWNQWLGWKNYRWTPDSTLETFDLIRQHVRSEVPTEKQFLKATSVSAIEKLARADRRYAATVDQWDKDDYLLNTPNGAVNLRDGIPQESDPALYMSKSTIVAPTGKAPRWLAFLDQVTDGDREYQAFLQRFIGYAASGFTHEHAMFFLYGPGGNGKGIFLNTIQAVMGDYATVASMETFTDSKNDRHPTDMAMLQGARMVFAQETKSGRAWAESKIKSLTGGDPITARFMRQDFFTFVPKFKLLISGNHMPKLKNVDEAMRRRLYLLPFTQTFKGKDRDPHLAETLTHEYEGILQWIVEGAIAYENEGLKPPLIVQEATNTYFESEDFFNEWLAACCELGANAYENPTNLFNSFKSYTEEINEPTGSDREFRQRLEKAGFTRGSSTSKGGRFWRGLRLTPTSKH
ncbi:phage/plasmid primase, P4 family [Pseudomonadales bacterium]|nr:phage/plasmid primase, P4 family [Pseudomonadales bacterium]